MKHRKRASDYLMLYIPTLVVGVIFGVVFFALINGFWPALLFLLPGSLWLLLAVDQWERWEDE